MFKNNEFMCVVHYAHDGGGSGASADDAKSIASGVMFNVPEGVVVTDAHVNVSTVVAGTTAIEVGDGTDADGYVTSANVTLGTVGLYVGSGALLNAKIYTAGDTIDLAATGASSAGAFEVVVRGYRI